jgi:transcriptional regulator with XRE-family HTH domain
MPIQGFDIRLKAIRKELKINQQQLAEKLNLTSATVSRVESGGGDLTAESFEKLIEIYNINLNWLISGFGNMFNTDDIQTNVSNPKTKTIEELEMQNMKLQGRVEELEKVVDKFMIKFSNLN